MIDTSSGTFRSRSAAARSAPIACWSELAKIAVGRSGRASSLTAAS
jgi:hypothetical protein